MHAIIKLTNWLKSNFKIIIVIFAIVFCLTSLFSANAFAEESSTEIVETTFFGNLKDDGKGCGVYTILNMVVDIMTIGVGILGVIGIMVVGIQYLTAGGNEAQTQKAKRRIAEIAIGLVAFAVVYAFLQWLLPGGKLNNSIECEKISDETLAQIREAEQKAKQEAAKANKNNKSESSKPSQSSPGNSVDDNASWGEKIAQIAKLLAWPSGNKYKKYWHHNYPHTGNKFKKWSDLGTARPNGSFMIAIDKVWPKHGFSSIGALGADCGTFVNVVLAYSGHDPNKAKNGKIRNSYKDYFSNQDNWKEIKSGKLRPGDVCVTRSGKFHTKIYLGDNKSAEAGYYGKNFGHIISGGCGSSYRVFRATN